MQNRKRKRNEDSLSADTITINRNNSSKKRKISRYSQEDKENISQESNRNENDIDDAFLSDIDNTNDTFNSCEFNDNDILSTTDSVYSDGVWSILVPTNENKSSILIQCDTFRIGRDEINDMILSNMCISATHCCITNNKIRDKILIIDDSKNGTYVENNKLEKNKEYILKNGNRISFTKNKQFNYYFFMIKYFENNINKNKEFNVILNKIDNRYYLKINENEWIYDERIYNKKMLSKCIGKLQNIEFDIPLSINKLIVEYYGFDIMNIIGYHIGSERPTERNDRPVLIRSNTMCGSPIHGLTQDFISQ